MSSRVLFSVFNLLIFSFWGSPEAEAQTIKEDSLLQVISENKNDKSSFKAFTELGELTSKANIQKAVSYYRKALALPFHMEYSREFVQAYISLGELYHILGRYDSSFIVCRQALLVAQKFNYESEMAQAYQEIGKNFLRLSQMDSARTYFQQGLAISNRVGDKRTEAGIYLNLGNVLIDETNYSEALNQFIKAEKIYEGLEPDKNGLIKVLSNIGNVEFIIGNYDKALEYTERSLQLSNNLESNLDAAYCHRLNGRIFRKKKDTLKAQGEYREALGIYIKRGDQRNEGETRQSIGNIYFDLHEFKNAIVEYEKSIQIGHHISNPSILAFAFSGMGFTWYELKEFNKAIAYFDSSIVSARKIKNFYLVMDAYQIISGIHKEQAHYKEALTFHHLYSALKDSLIEKENRQGTKELEAKYQNEKKQTQIELLQKNQLLKDISLRQNRTVQSTMVIAFLLLAIIAFLVYNRSRLVEQAKRHTEIQQMRNEISRDLHDDMGSTLSSIHIISQLALKENQGDPSSKYFQHIADHSAKMMEGMSDMVWSINPNNDSVQNMVTKMKEFSAEILEPKNISYQFQGEETLHSTVLDVKKRKNIFLIFKESINNAAKYSEGTIVHINLSEEASHLLLSIHDNGKGFDIAKVQSGNGLGNLRARANEINATLELESILGKGTTLKLRIPLT
jgi:two-component system, NarL family, sensor histidine kinase UhpB